MTIRGYPPNSDNEWYINGTLPIKEPFGVYASRVDIIYIYNIYYLVGGIPTPLKNMSSSVGMIIPNIWKT
jgi:hypothetical protein